MKDDLFQNRLSFRKYNSIRMTESFEIPEQAVVRSRSAATPTRTSRTHGRSPDSLLCDKDALLTEARTWSDDQAVNWTQLAKRYGVEGDNAGQCQGVSSVTINPCSNEKTSNHTTSKITSTWW